MGQLRFILGRAGSGKTTRVVEEIGALLRDEPLGDPILLLVPDQATLLYERLIACGDGSDRRVGPAPPRREDGGTGPTLPASALQSHKQPRKTLGHEYVPLPPESNGYLRLHVITFRHLIERLLTQGGGSSIPEITALGRRILIGRLLRRMQPELNFYKSVARQPGLAAKLDEAFAEIERSGRNLDDLPFIAAEIEAQQPQSSLPAKLRDLHLLIREYENVLGTERLDQHRRFTHALKAAEHSVTLPKTRIYVDDFYDFTSTERTLIVQLARLGLQTTVALAVDPAKASALTGNAPIEEDQLLRSSSLAYRRLNAAAVESHVPVERIVLSGAPRFQSQDLLHIDRQFEHARAGRIAGSGGVRFIEACTRRDEVDAAARQIQHWTTNGYRLRDILVLARDVADYQNDIEASFREHGLPCFIDRQRPAAQHPLIRTVRGLIHLSLSHFRHDAVLDLVKAGLVGVTDTDGDALDNYILAHRIRGTTTWAEQWTFRHRQQSDDGDVAAREQLDAINAVRHRLFTGVAPLISDETPQPTSHWCSAICASMETLQVDQHLAQKIAAREEAGDLEGAAADHAVWTEFTELLDQLCSVLGDEALTLREFSEVIDVALERFTLAITPPTIDQVLVGSVDRTRASCVKACIVLGLSEGTFPRRSDDVAALNDDDRRHLDSQQFELRNDSRRALFDERTLAYLAFTRASQQLVLIRNTVEVDGRAIAPSAYWTQVFRLFNAPDTHNACDPHAVDAIATASQLAGAIVRWSELETPDITQEQTQLTHWFLHSHDPQITRNRSAMQRAMNYHNDASLSSAIAADLFPQPAKMSATRFETYAACPFKHFAQNTLRLRKREEADLTRMDLGTVYHSVLERLIRSAIGAKLNLAEPIPELELKIRSLSESAASEMRSEFMLTPGRNQHMVENIRNTIEHVAESQRHAIAAGAFRPRQTEFAFGLEGHTPPLAIQTPKGRVVHLRGKIDRIDAWPMGSDVAASVIDYKLGAHKADFVWLYHGLSLQLATYLLVLDSMGETLLGKPVTPAAAFYVQLLRSIDRINHPALVPNQSEPATYLKKYKPRGLIHEAYVESLDANDTLKLKPPASDKLKRGDVLRTDAFEGLLNWTRDKLAQLADRIIDGDVSVRPFRHKTRSPCSNCDFRSVCRLDLAFNRYLNITINADEAVAAIAGVDKQ